MSETEHHFFASSLGEWAITDDKRDLRQLLNLMHKGKMHYKLYLVPLPAGTIYGIRNYVPVVEGLQFLGDFMPPKLAKWLAKEKLRYKKTAEVTMG